VGQGLAEIGMQLEDIHLFHGFLFRFRYNVLSFIRNYDTNGSADVKKNNPSTRGGVKNESLAAAFGLPLHVALRPEALRNALLQPAPLVA
jgi:hypothetical protein